ncbi:MAG TPA: CsbD family protein [Streptosporangiaceae bacterium]|nr:CsbD family protein [Streptosporangiaceae bacterium]
MGFMDKLRNRFKMAGGRAREGMGRATGDPYLESKGQAERAAGAGRQVGEQVKDAAKNVRKAFKQ